MIKISWICLTWEQYKLAQVVLSGNLISE